MATSRLPLRPRLGDADSVGHSTTAGEHLGQERDFGRLPSFRSAVVEAGHRLGAVGLVELLVDSDQTGEILPINTGDVALARAGAVVGERPLQVARALIVLTCEVETVAASRLAEVSVDRLDHAVEVHPGR